MSKNTSLITSALCVAAMALIASPSTAQRPAQGEPARPQETPPAPPPSRPQPPPTPPPSRDQQTEQQRQQAEQQRQREEQQRVENARAQQEQQRAANARAQQEQQRIENARQQQEQERTARARQNASTTAAAATPANREIISQLIGAEHLHRDQLARINRLKQLAQRQNQSDRVRELDRLLDQSNSTFQSHLDRAKGKLSEPEYTNTVAMLEQGRRREVRSLMGGGGEASTTPANTTRQATPAPEHSRQPAPSQPPR
jgi:flagellar biosynthesis GTPase FlhF